MSKVTLLEIAASAVKKPLQGSVVLFIDKADKIIKYKDYLGTISTLQVVGDAVDAVIILNSKASFPPTGNIRTLYVDKSQSTIYYWSGTTYVVLTGTPAIRNYTNSSTLTGTTNETQLGAGLLIPSTKMVVGDIVVARALVTSAGASGSSSIKLYINTSDSLVGAIYVGGYSAAAFRFPITRHLLIKAANQTAFMWSSEVGILDDMATVGNNANTALEPVSNIDWTVDQYLIVTFTPSVIGAESVRRFIDAKKE